LRARLLALIVAAAMVGGAILIRNAIDDDGGNRADNDGKPVLLCARELGSICEQLQKIDDIEILEEDARATATALAALPDDQRRTLPYDGWVTFGHEVDLVRAARNRSQASQVLDKPGDPAGRSPFVIGVARSREDTLRRECGGDVSFQCLGEVAGVPWTSIGGEQAWGAFKPGHVNPEDNSAGLAIIGRAAARFLGTDDPSLADFESDDFVEWFARLEREVKARVASGETPFQQLVNVGAATYDVVVTTEAEAGPLLASAAPANRNRVHLLYPAPVASIDVVFASVTGRSTDLADILDDELPELLARAGYRVDGEDRADGVPDTPQLPERSRLPSGGSLEALLNTWREVTG
jgi:hypothetical protein